MTLITSWGGNGSNAYVSKTDAASFLTTSVVAHSDWDTASDAQKEAAILEATRDVDSLSYVGARYYYDQALLFPREVGTRFPWNRTATGSTVWSVTQAQMERDIKEATCHQALWILRGGGRNYHAERIAQGIKAFSEAIGPIRESYEYSGASTGGASSKISPDAFAKLSRWLTTRKVYRG